MVVALRLSGETRDTHTNPLLTLFGVLGHLCVFHMFDFNKCYIGQSANSESIAVQSYFLFFGKHACLQFV